MLERLKQLPPVASAMVPKPRKVVTGKKKSRNLIKVRFVTGKSVLAKSKNDKCIKECKKFLNISNFTL